MAKTKGLFEEAIADAKQVKAVAFQNAKLMLEEHFAPKLQNMVDKKLQESLEEEYEDDNVPPSQEEMDEKKKSSSEESKKKSSEESHEDDESIDLEELLKELESEEDPKDAKYSDEEMEENYASEEEAGKKTVKPMDEKKKSSEEESEGEEEIDEEHAQYLKLKEKYEGKKKSSEEEKKSSEEGEEEKDFDVDEDIDVEALLRELESGDEEDEKKSEEEVKEAYASEVEDKKKGQKPMDEKKELEKLKSDLHETNLLNSKLIYFGKLVKEHDGLSKSDKVNLLKQFDRCNTPKEAKLVYETITGSLKASKSISKTKKQIKESVSFASKAAGNSTAKKRIINEDQDTEIVNSDLTKRWQFLAGIKK